MALPTGFVALRQVLSADEKHSSFLGAISHIQAPVQTENGWLTALTIRDQFPGEEKDAVQVRLQLVNAEHLPKGEPGDVAIVRNMRVEIHDNKKTLVNSKDLQSQAIFFPVESIPADTPSAGDGSLTLPYSVMRGSRAPDAVEQIAVINMKKSAAPLLADLKDKKNAFFAKLPPQSARSLNKKGKKVALLSEMTFQCFHDFVGEVVKTFWSGYETIDLYVTDYTTNEALYLYENPDDHDDYSFNKKPWPGPFGQMTMAIRLYPPHTDAARVIKEGDFVFLQNIRTKMSQANKLEAALHADPKYPSKIGVHICKSQTQLKPLLDRKEAYEKEHVSKRMNPSDPMLGLVQEKASEVRPMTKKQLKESKRAEQRQRKEQELKELEETLKEREAKDDEARIVRKGLNKHVSTGYKDIQLSSVEEIVNNPYLRTKTGTGDILELPFINSKYRTHVRIVDHYPLSLKNFTRPKEYYQSSNNTTDSNSQDKNFEWHFFLLVEDANAVTGTTPVRFPILVDSSRAQNLLGIDPVNLRERPDKLRLLQEKLFVLWGNLHERKVALKKQGINLPLPVGDTKLALSNKPFECCIEEYGMPVDAKGAPFVEIDTLPVEVIGDPQTWKRTWSLHNTTIRGV